MGADQEGARVITAQSKAEENHYKLHHRWAMDCIVYSARLNLHSFSSHHSCDCCGFSPWLFVCLCTRVCVCASVLGVTHAFRCNTQGQPDWAAPQAVDWERQDTVFALRYVHTTSECVSISTQNLFSLCSFFGVISCHAFTPPVVFIVSLILYM